MTCSNKVSGSIGVALMVAVLLAIPARVSAEAARWDRLADGLEVTVWMPGEACAQVPPLYMVKIDAERFRFSIYHYRTEGLDLPLTLGDWHQRTKALVLFNAGLFMDDFSYLGLLYKDGKPLGGRRHGQWQGLF